MTKKLYKKEMDNREVKKSIKITQPKAGFALSVKLCKYELIHSLF